MKTISLTISVTFLCLFVSAQKNGLLKGKLSDSSARQPLSEATVIVLRVPDSAVIAYTLSDKKGLFEIANLAANRYLLIATHAGFSALTKKFLISTEKPVVNLGELYLVEDYKTLTGVVITENPIRISGDTISFRPNAFSTKPGATVEDVLKRLPGLQVLKDGTVRVMGETVQKVYVDGKEFFGSDPKIATRNLTADMVEQIQVFDDMSDQSRFTKIDDGSRTKSINIKLKKDKNKGEFGKVGVGYGTDNRYDAGLFLNHFRGQRRISIIGSANNTNKVNYTFNDVSGGGSTSQFSSNAAMSGNLITASSSISPGGVSTPLSTGINYNDKWGTKLDFRGSYYFSDNKNLLVQKRFRQNIFPDDSLSEVNTVNEIRSHSKSHRVNGRWEYFIDSMNSLLYNANLQWQSGDGDNRDTSSTISSAINTFLAVTSSSIKSDNREGINYNGELLYRRRFKRPGRTVTLGWRNNSGDNNSELLNNAPVTSYSPNGIINGLLHLNQHIFHDNKTGNHFLSTSFTEPLGVGKLLELNYTWSVGKNIADKKTYDFDSLSGKYSLSNELLTNNFQYRNASNRIGANFRQQKKKYNYQLGMAVQFTNLENHSRDGSGDKDTVIAQTFINLFPTAQFNYAISKTKSIRIAYRGRTNAPTVSQLQDAPDVNNPLQIKTGNPDLKPELINNLNINYNSYQLLKRWIFSANLNINYTGNKIVNSMDSASSVIIINKPENMNGSYNAAGSMSLNFPLDKMKNTNINLSNNSFYSRNANLVFGKKNFTRIFVFNQAAGLGFSRDKFDLLLSGAVEFNQLIYELNPNSNEKYLNQAYSADFSYRLKNNFFWLSDFDYYITTGREAGYNQDIFLWNMSVAKKILKNNAAEIKLTAYDILKQNKGVNRFAGENYFEDVRSNVVPRLFLLSINYNFNRMGGKKEQTTDSTPPMHYFR